MNSDAIVVSLIAGIVMGAMIASLVWVNALERSVPQREAINRGYALHCPVDGKFAWVGECAALTPERIDQ